MGSIKKLLTQPDAMLNELETLKRKDNHRQTLVAKQAQIEKQLKQLESRQERLLDLYVDGAIKKAAFIERSRNLEREKDSLTKKGNELSQELISEEERAFKATSISKLYKQIGKNLEEADYETKRFVISLLVSRISVNADRLDVECHIPQQFLDEKKDIHVALSRNPLPRCDTKLIILFSLELLPGKSLSQIRREQNFEYGLKQNLFYPNGRLKKRLGGKAKGNHNLGWHTKVIKDQQTLKQFSEVRNFILSSGRYQEEFRKRYIVFIDAYLYNRFMLLPHRNHFWLAVKGINLHEDGFHSHSDGISTFFRVTSDSPLEMLREIILKHTKRLPPTQKDSLFLVSGQGGKIA